MLLSVIIAFLWYIIGVWSFIFWWTKDSDLKLIHFMFGLVTGLTGPIAFILGWFMHGDPIKWGSLINFSKVIKKKRIKNESVFRTNR